MSHRSLNADLQDFSHEKLSQLVKTIKSVNGALKPSVSWRSEFISCSL